MVIYRSFCLKKPLVLFLIVFLFQGCEKKIEDTESYQKLLKTREELERRLDSLKREEFKMLEDSVMIKLRSKTDSLKQSSDSLKRKIEKKIRKNKNNYR